MVGTGDMLNDGWDKIGNASSLEIAKAMMLNYSKCAKEGAILFYSQYQYWGVRCATTEMMKGQKKSNNSNWEQYQLSFQGIYYHRCTRPFQAIKH